MKALTCEMCGSTNLIKEEGVFVCQSCGTKYSVEEARKMMVEGTVDIKGVVKIDTSSELQNLYEIARRAKDTENAENAAKYYDQILVKDPNSWEANFYVVYYKAMSCKIAEICSAGISVANCIPTVAKLIKSYVPSDEQGGVVAEIFAKSLQISGMLSSAADDHYFGIDESIQADFIQEYINNVASSAEIMYTLGDSIDEVFGEQMGTFASSSWKAGIDHNKKYLCYLADIPTNVSRIESYRDKIIKYDAEYKLPTLETSSGGCYIATAVYGSYDCPSVWTLRRFRDYTLAKSIFGRTFVKIYYAVSPTLVKWFGHSTIFKKMWKMPLDKLVATLNDRGVQNTPYEDKEW